MKLKCLGGMKKSGSERAFNENSKNNYNASANIYIHIIHTQTSAVFERINTKICLNSFRNADKCPPQKGMKDEVKIAVNSHQH